MVEDGASLTQEPGPATGEGRPTGHNSGPSSVHLGPLLANLFLTKYFIYVCI